MEKAQKIKTYVLLHVLMLIFSLSPVCSKLAGQQPFLSFKFVLFYGLVILLLGIYALLWQQIIKRMPLTTAYANKAVTVVWGMVWGAVTFSGRYYAAKVYWSGNYCGGRNIVCILGQQITEEEGNR